MVLNLNSFRPTNLTKRDLLYFIEKADINLCIKRLTYDFPVIARCFCLFIFNISERILTNVQKLKTLKSEMPSFKNQMWMKHELSEPASQSL